MKKTISIILSLLFIFAVSVPAYAVCLGGNCPTSNCGGGNCFSFGCPSGSCGDFSYCLNNDGTACLTGYNGNCKNITLPSCVNGCPVTSVGSCFSDCSNCNLNNVTIPSSVKSIADNAFSDCTLNACKGSCAKQYAESEPDVTFKAVNNTAQPSLSKSSVTVKKGKTASVSIIGKKSGVDNKYTNTKYAKITSKASASKLTVKGLKKGSTTLKIRVNNSKTLSLKVKIK